MVRKGEEKTNESTVFGQGQSLPLLDADGDVSMLSPAGISLISLESLSLKRAFHIADRWPGM